MTTLSKKCDQSVVLSEKQARMESAFQQKSESKDAPDTERKDR